MGIYVAPFTDIKGEIVLVICIQITIYNNYYLNIIYTQMSLVQYFGNRCRILVHMAAYNPTHIYTYI